MWPAEDIFRLIGWFVHRRNVRHTGNAARRQHLEDLDGLFRSLTTDSFWHGRLYIVTESGHWEMYIVTESGHWEIWEAFFQARCF